MEFSLLWSLGLIASIIIFSVAIGLIITYKDINKKGLAKFSIVSIISTFMLVYAIDIFKVQLNSFIGNYCYLLLFLISFILMFVGYLINREKDFEWDFIKSISLSYVCFILLLLICIGSKESLFGLNSLQISLLITLLFNSLIIVFYSCKRLNFMNNSNKTLGNAYFIMGIYCLMVSLFLPNIISLDMDYMNPINVVSIEQVGLTIVLLAIVVVLGLAYYKKNTLFK